MTIIRTLTAALSLALPCYLANALSVDNGSIQSRRDAFASMLIPAAATFLSTASAATPAVAAETQQQSTASKFQRYPQLRFIAALGDPKASSGTGAETWGLWRDDPGPRGFYLRDYNRKLSPDGKAPGGWMVDRDAVWIEEHGLVMPSPGDLPRKSVNGSTKEVLPYKRYVVTGDREVTSILTVHEDGRWELGKGNLYDVTHLPCRSAVYTPVQGQPSGACVPTPDDQKLFPVTPGAEMPKLASSQCGKLDYAVLFVLGEEVIGR